MWSRCWVGSASPGKWRKCHQWNVSKSTLGGGKLGLQCFLPCPWIDRHSGEPSCFPWRYQGFGVYACPWIWRCYVWGWNRVWYALYGTVDSLWVVGACILTWSESPLQYLLRMECLCIGTWHQLWPRGHWVGVVGVFHWGWENVLFLWCMMGGCYLGAGWNGWYRQRDGQLDHHAQKQQGEEGILVCEFWVAHCREVCGYF